MGCWISLARAGSRSHILNESRVACFSRSSIGRVAISTICIGLTHSFHNSLKTTTMIRPDCNMFYLPYEPHAPQVSISMLILYIEGAIQPLLTKPPENLYSESIFRIHKLVIRQKPPNIQEPDGETRNGKVSILPKT